MLREIAGGDFAGLDEAKAEAAAMTLLGREGPVMTALGRAVLQCYYRDDRVLGARSASSRSRPFRKAACWNRATGRCSTRCASRPRMWRDIDDPGTLRWHRRQTPTAARPADEIVDVLIIGAGASGAAVAWSLAETRMKILCLEQGDWVKSTDFPSNGRDWEARRYADFDISPNRRARDTDYPVNDDNSLMKIANFNGVGGGTILFTAHFPRMHPSDFRVRTLDGVADDWPIDYWTLEPYFAENDRMMGVAGLAGDPAYPPHEPTMPPVPLGKTGTRYARAMNKLGWHWWPSDIAVATTEYDGRGKCINLGHCTPGCAQGAKASVGHHLLAACAARPGGVAHALPGARDRHQRARHGVRRRLLRPERRGAVPAGGSGDPGGKRHRHAAPAAELGLVPLSQRPGQLLRPGRQEPDAAPLAAWSSAMSRRRWTATAGRRP